MSKKLIITFATFAMMTAILSSTYAQQKPESEQKKEPESTAYARGMRGKVFEIKHHPSKDLLSIVSTLGSGAHGSAVTYSSNPNTITVRDFPENLAVIEEAIKRLDVAPPQAPRPFSNIELYGYILIASNAEGPNSALPENIKDVLPQLSNTLSYKNYQLLATIVQRTSAAGGRLESSGSASPADKSFTVNYNFTIGGINPERPNDYSSFFLFDIKLFISPSGPEDHRHIGAGEIKTKLSLREGEKVVVGTASVKDKAMILVLSIKALK